MIRCVNENCKKDALASPSRVCVTVDGDFACSPVCAKEYERQREHFFAHIAPSDERTEAWLLGRSNIEISVTDDMRQSREEQ